jgi:hypothetical protein
MSDPDAWFADHGEAMMIDTDVEVFSLWADSEGTTYEVVALARNNEDAAPIVVYRLNNTSECDVAWFMPLDDFEDGRFMPMDDPPED